MDVFEVERRARVGGYRLDLGVAHFQVLHVAEKEALRGSRAEHARLGILGLVLGHLNLGRIRGRAADVLHIDVRELDVFDEVAGDSAEDRAVARGGVEGVDVVDEDAAQGAHLGGFFRPAQARAEAQEDGAVVDIAHGEVGHRDVFQQGAVDGFERQASAALEDAVGDGDIDKSAVGLGATLDAAGAAAPPLVGAVEHRAQLPAAGDVAVGDGDVLGGLGKSERVAGFRADAVVPRGVDGAVGNVDVLTAIDVHAVAVGVDLEVVDGEIVDAREQQAKVAALENREVAEDDVAAALEGDGLVADAGLLGAIDRVGATSRASGPEAEALAPDKPRPGDREVADVLAPDQRVVPMVVAVVLVSVPGGLGLGGVVGSAHVAGGLAGKRRLRGDDSGTLREVEVNVALETDGERDIVASGEDNCASASGRDRLDGLVDGGRVDRLAVAGGSEGADVEEHGRGRPGRTGVLCGGEGGERRGCRRGKSHAAELQQVTACGIECVHCDRYPNTARLVV